MCCCARGIPGGLRRGGVGGEGWNVELRFAGKSLNRKGKRDTPGREPCLQSGRRRWGAPGVGAEDAAPHGSPVQEPRGGATADPGRDALHRGRGSSATRALSLSMCLPAAHTTCSPSVCLSLRACLSVSSSLTLSVSLPGSYLYLSAYLSLSLCLSLSLSLSNRSSLVPQTILKLS